MPKLLEHIGTKMDFLIAHGFQIVCQSETQFVYESDRVRIAIKCDNSRDFGLLVELSVASEKNGQFDFVGELWEFEEMNQYLPRGIVFPLQASTDRALESSIDFVAKYLRDHGEKLIDGNRELFRKFKGFREARILQYNLEISLQTMRRQAASAWSNRDFRTLKQLYEPYFEHLTPSERVKLEHARKNVGQ